MEQNERRFESVRCGGTEVLRTGSVISGFQDIPEGIADFYRSLAATSVSSASELLRNTAEQDFLSLRSENAGRAAFYKRQNYLFECRGRKLEGDFFSVETKISFTHHGKEDIIKKMLHVWNGKSQTMVSGGMRKNLLRQNVEIVKK